MTPNELVHEVADDINLHPKIVALVLTSTVATIVSRLADGREVWIKGLGKFIPKDRKERQARNPQTGEPAVVPARRVITFKPSKAAKDIVAGEDA